MEWRNGVLKLSGVKFCVVQERILFYELKASPLYVKVGVKVFPFPSFFEVSDKLGKKPARAANYVCRI